MSYDLMFFDKEKAPKNREKFMNWYEQQTAWTEEHSYQDPAVTSEGLRNLFMELITVYPPMNGELAPTDEQLDEWEETEDIMASRITDYSIGTKVIYCAFAWSVADEAYTFTKELAKKHKIGFYNVSETNGEIDYND